MDLRRPFARVLFLSAIFTSTCVFADSDNPLPRSEQQIVNSLPILPSGLNPGYAIEIRPAQTVAGALDYTLNANAYTANQWEAFLPYPPDLPCQKVHSVLTTPRAEALTDKTPLARPMLRMRPPAGASSIHIVYVINATLYSRKLVAVDPSRPTPPTIPWSERCLALRPSETLDYMNPAFQDWMVEHDLLRPTDEGEIAYARRVFQFIAKKFAFWYYPYQDKTASLVCGAYRSDSGGLVNVFVATLRSQGVPARKLAGRWALTSRPNSKINGYRYYQGEVKAEFYADGVGWVPVDLYSGVMNDPTPEKLRYFGVDPGDAITFHIDPDFKFDSKLYGPQREASMQSVKYWATGSGDWSSRRFWDKWTVVQKPLLAP